PVTTDQVLFMQYYWDLFADLDAVIAATSSASSPSLGADLTERLDLPDLRMPRFDVPNHGPVASEEVLRAFQGAFRRHDLVARTATALTKLYEAFSPLVADRFPSNPFTTLTNRFGFLDTTPVTTDQVLFMQYYWDLFDDLLAAYDEVRWKGVDLMCACCPPAGLFPRHLMAGVLAPELHDPADHRHHFLPSPAVGDCEDRTREVRLLFARLVEILAAFTETPPDDEVRITPSRWGDVPPSAKAIPYYYDHDGTPPLYELWDPVKTARHRANQNLGYRADEYTPPAPGFVTEPLRFDLEPTGFLRIEGHLGRNVDGVVAELLAQRTEHRLPFEVVALRAGTFDEDIEIDLSEEDCRFQDLETLYAALRSELVCSLVKTVTYLYALPAHDDVDGTRRVAERRVEERRVEEAAPDTAAETESRAAWLGLLRDHAPDVVVAPGTLGYEIEGVLADPEGAAELVFADPGRSQLSIHVHALVGALSDLAARVPDDPRTIDLPDLADRYHHLVDVARTIEDHRREGVYDAPGLSDRLDDLVFRCRLDSFEALDAEYERRVREVKQAQFLGHFLARHPGVQHKAGVPLGGTFVLVTHHVPRHRWDRTVGPSVAAAEAPPPPPAAGDSDDGLTEIEKAIARLGYKDAGRDADVKAIVKALTGSDVVHKEKVSKAAAGVYLEAVADLADGTVIADLFLPYSCCSDCPPIHFTLPPARLRVRVSVACTDAEGFAAVTLTTEGATGALSAQVDGGAFAATDGTLWLEVGDHTVVVRDAVGAESSPITLTIPPPLMLGEPQIFVDEPDGTYSVAFGIYDGTPPYRADSGTIIEGTYENPSIPIGDELTVVITDAAGCTVTGTFGSGVEPCDLPCRGEAERWGHRFWVPEAREGRPLNQYKAEVTTFVITDPDGGRIDLTADVTGIVSRPQTISATDLPRVVERWLEGINRLVADAVGSDQWLRFEYEPAPESATTGTLFIDRLACVEVVFELIVGFVQGRSERELELGYSRRGTVLVDRTSDTKLHIPPFDGSTSNKCKPDEEPVPVCEGTDLEVRIMRDGVFPSRFFFGADVSGSEAPAAYLWEIADARPSVAGGESVWVEFDPPEPVDKLVRLTVFTERGCTVTVERTFDIFKSED
ncbi:MAG TPA: hypothetical protein VF228_21915, partial [Iamia sp.]